MIHLVSFYYGGEPNQKPDIPRRSWTQWEYYRAMEGEHPKRRTVARENCAFDARPEEDREEQRLQREHWERLRKPGGPIYYEFSTPQELRERILGIDELRELVRPRLARIPFLALGDKFIGRRQLLKTLQQELTTGTTRLISQPIGVHADGGGGKTALFPDQATRSQWASRGPNECKGAIFEWKRASSVVLDDRNGKQRVRDKPADAIKQIDV